VGALNAGENIIMTTQTMSKEAQQCIEGCKECQKCCVALEKSGGVDSETIQTAKDCAELCQTCSNFVLRESQFAAAVCKLCAEVCQSCAAVCERTSRGSIAKDCAAACRRCAETCASVGSPVHA
jgi:hypothetical protein